MAQCVIDSSPLALGHVGLGVYTSRLIKLLSRGRKPWQIAVLASETTKHLLPPSTADIRTYPATSGIPGFLAGLADKRRAAALALQEFPSSIYISPAPMWAPAAPRKTVVVLHDLIYRRFPWYEGRFRQRRLVNRLCERFAVKSRHIVTVSSFSRQEIMQTLNVPEGRITCIPNWIEDDFVSRALETDLSDLRSRLRLPGEYWLYVGGYDFRKNVEFLLHAYSTVREKATCPPLVLAGKIPLRPHRTLCAVHKTIEQLSLQKNIILPGFITDEDLPGLYRGASLMIFPSKCEGFGYSPLEANACGTPVLVADNSSLREVVPPSSRFPDGETKHLTNRLLDIVNGRNTPPVFRWDAFTESAALENWNRLLEKVNQR